VVVVLLEAERGNEMDGGMMMTVIATLAIEAAVAVAAGAEACTTDIVRMIVVMTAGGATRGPGAGAGAGATEGDREKERMMREETQGEKAVVDLLGEEDMIVIVIVIAAVMSARGEMPDHVVAAGVVGVVEVIVVVRGEGGRERYTHWLMYIIVFSFVYVQI
jgi:hypothetical protein